MFAGIDTHKDTLAVAVIDQVGLPVARAEEPNTRSGFVRVGELLAAHDVRRVGIEGSGAYGRCVAAYLVLDWDQPGVGVVEVPTLMTSRERGARPGKGKTDPVDAVAIARITMRDPDLPPVRLAVGEAADLRALLDYRDDLVRERGELANRIHAELHGLFPGYHQQIPNLITRAHLDAAARLLADDTRVRAGLARSRLARVIEIDAQTAELKQRIAGYVAASGTSLTSIYGVGPIIAARFLAEVVDIHRYPNRNAFAATNGTAPLSASSGRTQRHRFNPGGNRRLNKCLHGRDHSDPRGHRGSRLLPAQTRGRQDQQGSPSLPETAAVRHRLLLHATRLRQAERGWGGRGWRNPGTTNDQPASSVTGIQAR